jgi:hypothetical protein
MSLAAIRNGLVETIQNYGKWSSSQVSTCDFGIAEACASCVVLQPGPGSVFEPITYMGGDSVRAKRNLWDISGVVMVKDPGDPTALLGNLWTACDDIYNSINSDDTLGGAADAAMVISISRPGIDAFIDSGNNVYGFITFTVRAQEAVG